METQELISYFQRQYLTQNVRLIGSGWSSEAYEVGDKIIRIPKADTEQYRKEATLLSFLQGKIGVEIPKPKLVESPFFYAEHKKIEGLNWNIQTYNQLSIRQQNAFAKDIACFFADLHTIQKTEILKYIPEDQLKPYSLAPFNLFQECLKKHIPQEDIVTIYNWTADILKLRKDTVLVHKDFYEANTLVDENHRLKGVFDWANACIGNPEWDFMALYHPLYFPLLNKVLNFYQKETGRQITLTQIKEVSLANSLLCVQYFGRNPQLKIKMPKEWKRSIDKTKEALIWVKKELKK